MPKVAAALLAVSEGEIYRSSEESAKKSEWSSREEEETLGRTAGDAQIEKLRALHRHLPYLCRLKTVVF
uniref:Uncharacterized protein n=1 Tax=Steinernema glaseri TaxID=37863 RepID=A0A1I8A3P5_9BILA